MNKITALILAAGEGKRMKSKKSKLVHKICGKPMIEWVYDSIENAGIIDKVVVTGKNGEQVKECLKDKVSYVTQEQQLGTGHAVMQAEQHFKNYEGIILVLCGDTPLITTETITQAIKEHEQDGRIATVLTAEVDNPTGYGRIKRDTMGRVIGIVEHRDASDSEKEIREINSGMYIFSSRHLFGALKEIRNDNDQGEFYLTDALAILLGKGLKVGVYKMQDQNEVLGVNDRVQLQCTQEIMQRKILKKHMIAGVTIMDPVSTFIDDKVEIGCDTIIYPGTILEGRTVIGEDCLIGPNSRLTNTIVGNNTNINSSVIIDSTLGNEGQIGPFAYIRPESKIGDKVKIGDFVEIKKSIIENRTKIPHLAYIGDAEVGENTNIACGVITVNYNGQVKSKTIVGKNAFVGCNVNLVAPVKVNDNAYIAAGTTVTEEVPEYSMSIGRCRQENKEGWVLKKGLQRK
jgi:UDP-N-acetylglucosamine diphosphorylase/glucosamine-1-phosphate N-acetyltransferase